MRTLSEDDRETLAGVCQNWSVFVGTSKILNTLKTGEEWMKARKLWAISSDAYRNYTRGCIEFGLTPASRSRVHAPRQDKPSGVPTRERKRIG